MRARKTILLAVLAASLAAAPVALAYERTLNTYAIRQAYFLGKDTTFRYTDFAKDYVQALPVPPQGLHVARIEIATPFKQVVSRAREAPDGYSPLEAESDYRRQPPRLSVEVTLLLTPTFPGHTPYTTTIPNYGPIYFRDSNFWQEVEIRLVQQGEIEPVGRRGQPIYSCALEGGCWLTGAVVTVEFDPNQVASRPARVSVLSPGGQRVEAEFDLSRLR